MDTNNKHIDPAGLLPKYFAGEALPEERRQVEEWLSSDDRNRQEYEAFEKLWNITGAASGRGDINLDAEWKRMDSYINPVRIKTITLARVFRIAASVILVSALAFLGLKIAGTKSEKAPVAEMSNISLPDGSVISLNAGSKITYNKGFGQTHRNLNLKGEAYFEVKKNTALPFIVETQNTAVRVTGTKFNVRSYKEGKEVKVTVTEGSVAFYETARPAKKAELGAGETGMYDKSMKVIKKQEALNLNDIAWKTRIMDFSNTPLSEVGDIISNTYHRTVSIDPAVQGCSITVRFENQDLQKVLTILKSTLELSIATDGEQIIIKGSGC